MKDLKEATIRELRAKAAELTQGAEPVLVHRHSVPIAVLIPIPELRLWDDEYMTRAREDVLERFATARANVLKLYEHPLH